MDDGLFEIEESDNEVPKTTKRKKTEDVDLFDVEGENKKKTVVKTKTKTKVKKPKAKPEDDSQNKITNFTSASTPAYTSTVLTKKKAITSDSQDDDTEPSTKSQKVLEAEPRNKMKKKIEEKKLKEEESKSLYDDDDEPPPFPLLITTLKCSLMKRMFETIHALVSEAVIQFNPDHITIFGVDSSQVAIVGATLEKSKFEKYHCESQFDFGVDTAHMKEMIQPVQKYDSLTFLKRSYDETNEIELLMSMRDKDVHVITTITGHQMNIEEFEIPEHQYLRHMTFDSGDLQQYIAELNKVSTIAIFATNYRELRMVSSDVNPAILSPSPKSFLLYPSENGLCFVDGQKKPEEDKKGEETKKPVKRRKVKDIVDQGSQKIEFDSSYDVTKLALKWVHICMRATPMAKKVHLCFNKGEPMSLNFPTSLGPFRYWISAVNEDEVEQ